VVSAAGQQSVSTRHFNNLFLSISPCFGEQSNIEIICINFSQKICELFGATAWFFLAAGAMGQHIFPVRNF
jgi:hypothetical protein